MVPVVVRTALLSAEYRLKETCETELDRRWCTEKTLHMSDHTNESALSETIVKCSFQCFVGGERWLRQPPVVLSNLLSEVCRLKLPVLLNICSC